MGGRIAVPMALMTWWGILIGGGSVAATVAGLVVVAALAVVARGQGPRVASLILLLASLGAGYARGSGHHAVLTRSRDTLRLAESLFRIRAAVTEPPERESGEPLVTVRILASDPALRRGARVRLRLPAGTAVEWSDRLEALVAIEEAPGLQNPGGYDTRAALEAAAITARGRAFWAEVSPAAWPLSWPRTTVARWRGAIGERLDAHLSAGARELVIPLVLGDRSGLSTELSADLRASGLIHLLALSGLHVVWMAGLARGLAAATGAGARGRAMAGAACAILYAGIAGPLPSLMRAAATEVISSVAVCMGRALDPVQSLALSVMGLLLVAPGWASDLGFQLSCAATLGLVTLGPPLGAALSRWRGLGPAFTPTLSAQVTALPLLLGRFHGLSWVAPFSNLLAVPISGLLLPAAWLAAISECVIPGAGAPWFGACEVLAWALRAVAEITAHSPGAFLGAGPRALIAIIAAGGGGLLAAAYAAPRSLDERREPISRIRFAARLLGAGASVLALLLTTSIRPLRPPAGRFWLVALDVGQGDALALGFEDGWWLVDAGPHGPHYDAGERVILPFFRWAGVRRLEALVLTHDDGDHVGGAGAVLRGIGAKRVYAAPELPRVPGPSRRFAAIPVQRGAWIHAVPPVRVLWPPGPGTPSGTEPAIDRDNAAGVVLEVGEEKTRMLLLADVDSTIEAALSVEPDVAILKVAHHGSASSSGMSFINRIRPREALISCGRHNPFGHPTPAVLARLKSVGARIRRTDEAGALWFEVTTDQVRFLDWRGGESLRPAAIRSRPASPLPAQ